MIMTDQHLGEFPAEPRQPYAGHPYPGPPAPPPKPKTRKGLTVVIALAAFVLGLVIGNPASGTAPETVTEPRKPVTVPSTFGDGTYEVGVDIQPGRYKVTVPADGRLCLYQRLKDDTGDRGTIIAQDVKQPGAKTSVTIKASDGFFETSGCGKWVKQ
jgi:hypothetical protein